MAKDNIYDLIITELILRIQALAATSNAPSIILTSSVNTTVAENFNSSGVFVSQVINIPAGYSIQANSHIITYPTAVPPTTGSAASLASPSINVILSTPGSTFVVTSTVILEHATDPDIVLNQSYTITAIAPMYFGVKAFDATPTTSGLNTTASDASTFQLTNTIVGRLYIVRPIGATPVVSVSDHNGLVTVVANDYTIITSGGLDYYILNYDTQLTGTNIKTFTLNF